MASSRFFERSVIVTGASSGIGEALALRLADEGAWLGLAARRADRLEAVAAACRQRGGRALTIPTDVSDEAACRSLVERARKEFGRIDMLVNNAGLSVVALLEDLQGLDLFRHVMQVNFYGALHCTFHALPHLIESRGRLVNVSSLGGKFAIPYNSSYVASKFALGGLSDALRLELKRHGVSVTLVCPYWVVSEFHESYLDREGQRKGPAGRALYTPRTMTADRCAQITLEAAYRRRRDVLMGPGRFMVPLQALAPALADRLILRSFMRSVRRRRPSGTPRI
jgi:short-subunit dehydrogenase